MNLYLLDSNIFIEAKNRYYGMDFCPAFWDFLDAQIIKTNIVSIKDVYTELTKGTDDLGQWIKERKDSGFFLPVEDEETQMEFMKIVQYVSDHYSQEEANRFLNVADPWLIAKAKVLNATLITQEVLAPSNTRKVKIPNICQQFGVNFATPFNMLRNLDAKFVL
ncbi:MAG: DUF4411 family protein [Campylobacterota bacterium]|nr:DUF4411 family protein [Campylobacterota bacterium]